MELRNYQEQCVKKIIWEKGAQLPGNSLCVLPTGSGKSVVIAELAHRLNEPILILQPSKEILEQNLEKLLQYVDESEIGIFSASMGEKTVGYYTFATIQSIYKCPEYFQHFKLVIIDEAHLVNPKSLFGMFTSFIKAIGSPKIIGFTATPYRQDTMYFSLGNDEYRMVATTKLINRMKGFFWQRVLFNMNIQDLIDQKFLCPLEYHDYSLVQQSEIPLNKSESDFDLDAYEMLISSKREKILNTVKYAEGVSKNVLVFCSSVSQAVALADKTPGAAVITAKTNKKEREDVIDSFKNGTVKTVFNVGVLTTGFDHPALDCIILNRPTRSIALYSQMLGRGVRIAPGKTACKVIDLTSTVKSLGRVETIKMVKKEKWELESETRETWHNTELYDFTFKRKPKESKFAGLMATIK